MALEWTTPRDAEAVYVTEPGEIFEAHGFQNDGPALLIESGDQAGVVIEASTGAEIVAWLRALADRIEGRTD